MTIDEVIKELKFDKASEDTIYNEQFYDLLIELLGELKYHKSLLENTKTTNPMYEVGYNKAIEDCLIIAKNNETIWNGGSWTVREIEQLKGGASNE